MRFKVVKNFIFILAIGLLCGVIGYKAGTTEVNVRNTKAAIPNIEVVNKLPPDKRAADFSLFWKVWDEITTKYVDKSKVDSQKMVYGAISGMVASIGDPYTMFLPPAQNAAAKEDLNGSFEGIGAQLGLNKDNRIVVIAPLPDSPAENAGIIAGDIILKIDGKDTTNLVLQEAVNKIRGVKGTKVTLNIFHPKDTAPVDIAITRDQIVLKSVAWKPIENVVYMQLARFGDQTDPQWDQTVTQINSYLATNSGKTKGLILDVRNNPGGLLSGAVYIASEFLSSGVVVKQQSYLGDTQSYSVNRRGKLLDIPMVVLVNQGTASASEILAGSLQAANRAKIVGVQSFGKGSVQEAEDLPAGAGLHITIAKWLLSNDVWVSGKGLTPDVIIENDIKEATADAQLKKAVELLSYEQKK